MANPGFRSLLAFWIGGASRPKEQTEYKKLPNSVIIGNYYPINIVASGVNFSNSILQLSNSVIASNILYVIPNPIITSGIMLSGTNSPIVANKRVL